MNRRGFLSRLLAASSLPAALKAAETVQPETTLLSGRALALSLRGQTITEAGMLQYYTDMVNLEAGVEAEDDD